MHDRDGGGGRTRGKRGQRRRRVWRRVVDGASEIIEGVAGALRPPPRPVVVPIPVRTTPRVRRPT